MRPAGETDFWRDTHFGFRLYSGHALLLPVESDFAATVAVEGRFVHEYDQLGLFLAGDEGHWMKLSLERVGALMKIVCVVTDGRSDAALMPYPHDRPQAELRLSRRGDAVTGEWRVPGGRWDVLRLAPAPVRGAGRVGIMACAPKAGGFAARFSGFRISAPEPDFEA
jgi:regulation of enolase protein 1 (concanavalin A-like superfamily)